MKRYTVEYNNKRYVIEGDKEPTEYDMEQLVSSQQSPEDSAITNGNTQQQINQQPRESGLKQYGMGLAEGIVDESAPVRNVLKAGSQLNPLLKPLEYGMTKIPAIKDKSLTDFTEQTREEMRNWEKPKTAGGQTARMAGYLTPMVAGGYLARNLQVDDVNYLYKKSKEATSKATKEYRTILRPIKSEIKNIEIRGNKNIDKYYRIAAEEELPIKTGADGKLDTLDAIEKIMDRQKPIHNEIQKLLRTKTKKQIPFDLYTIGNKAKKELAKRYKNAKEYEQVVEMVDDYIQAEVERYGSRFLTGEQLNNVKQGMWSVGYDIMKPSSNKVSRKIGHIAKEAIENAYPRTKIKDLNKVSGDLATLSHLLEAAHGRVIQGGKIGKYGARLLGAMALDRIPVVGPLVGARIGDITSKAITSPERMSSGAIKLLKKSKGYQGNIIKQLNKNKNITKTSDAVNWIQKKLNIPKEDAINFIKEFRGKLFQ